MSALNESQKLDLEGLIDGATLAAVVEALSEIAYGKAEHIEASYQDMALARQWRIAGEALLKLAARKEVASVP